MTRRSVVLPSAALLLSFAFASAARAGEDVPPVPAESHGVAFEPGSPAFASVLAKAKETNRVVFVDFAADG